MIGRLSGILLAKTPPLLLIDVGGIGYEVFVPMSTYYHLPDIGKSIVLLIHHNIREDAQILYGFYEEKERALFRELIKISGVGPKMALTILSGMDVATFLQCVEYRDVNVLVRLPGVGKKTAERLMVEMAGKLMGTKDKAGNSESFSESMSILKTGEVSKPLYSPTEEAVGALVALGYKSQEAFKAVSKVIEAENAISEEKTGNTLATRDIIRRALQGFAKV